MDGTSIMQGVAVVFTAQAFGIHLSMMDYDKIEKNPYIRTRRTGDYMVINAQGNTKKLNRCMIDEKIPSEYRDSIPLIACGKEILWMVGSRMNERYKINPQTRKVLVLNYQGGNENE